MNKRKLVKDYDIIHQATIWNAYDSDIIRYQIWELKDKNENTPPSEEKPMYYYIEEIDGLGICGWCALNDIATAFHILHRAYYNEIQYIIEAPF